MSKASEHYRAAEESFQRCDTDGFVSQWAHGINGDLARLQAEIDANGGMAEFPALFDLNGHQIPAKLINGRFGVCWALQDDKDQFTGMFIKAFPARKSTMTRKGYREGTEMAPAKAVIHGTGRGLSGAASCRAVVVRT